MSPRGVIVSATAFFRLLGRPVFCRFPGRGAYGRRLRCKVRVFCVLLFISSTTGSAGAKESQLYTDAERQTFRMAYESPPNPSPFSNSEGYPLLSRTSELDGNVEQGGLSNFVTVSLLRTAAHSDSSIVILHRRLPSRHAYYSWADLHTGYGELFPADKLGRSRTNGAGFEDLRWFYLKMSLTF